MDVAPGAAQILIETYRQLAYVSAVLGGFSCAFLGVMLAAADSRRVAGATVAMATLSAVALVTASVLGSFLVSVLNSIQPASFADVPGGALRVAGWVMAVFDVGVVALLLGLGLSGWLRSRLVGWLATAAALGGLAMLVWAATLLGLTWGPLVP